MGMMQFKPKQENRAFMEMMRVAQEWLAGRIMDSNADFTVQFDFLPRFHCC